MTHPYRENALLLRALAHFEQRRDNHELARRLFAEANQLVHLAQLDDPLPPLPELPQPPAPKLPKPKRSRRKPSTFNPFLGRNEAPK